MSKCFLILSIFIILTNEYTIFADNCPLEPVLVSKVSKLHGIKLSEMQYLVNQNTFSPSYLGNITETVKLFESRKNLQFSGGKNPIWIFFCLKNDLANKMRLHLLVKYPVSHLELTAYNKNRKELKAKSGLFHKNLEHSKAHVITLEIDGNDENVIYLKAQSPFSMTLNPDVLDDQGLLKTNYFSQLFFGVYIGIILIIIFYSSMIYFVSKDRIYLVYIFFVIFTHFFGVLTAYGVIHNLIMNSSSFMAEERITIALTLMVIATLIFCREYLNTKINAPKMHNIIGYFSIFTAIVGFVSLFYIDVNISAALDLLVFLGILLIIGTSFYLAKMKLPSAGFFSISVSCFLSGGCYYVLQDNGILPMTNLGHYSLLIGSLIECILFTIALSDRFRSLENKVLKTEFENKLLHSEKLAALGTLSAGMAHELGNILNITTMAVRGVKIVKEREKIESTALSEFQVKAAESLQQAKQIIGNLNSVSRHREKAEIINLKNQIAITLSLIGQKERHGTDIRNEVPDEVYIEFSKVELAQVILNLIKNAVHALRSLNKDHPEIIIKATILESEAIAILTIKDNGSGVKIEEKEKIFEPFYTTKKAGEGTGLGLFMVRKIVDENKGKIRCISEQGVGTTFEISLPIKRVKGLRIPEYAESLKSST